MPQKGNRSFRKDIGDWGERKAAELLRNQSYTILETNFRCRTGEIDIVAQDDDCLVFVEVRTKSGTNFGSPEESITNTKKQKLISAAMTYIQGHEDAPESWRIDVVAIQLTPTHKHLHTEHIKNAIY